MDIRGESKVLDLIPGFNTFMLGDVLRMTLYHKRIERIASEGRPALKLKMQVRVERTKYSVLISASGVMDLSPGGPQKLCFDLEEAEIRDVSHEQLEDFFYMFDCGFSAPVFYCKDIEYSAVYSDDDGHCEPIWQLHDCT